MGQAKRRGTYEERRANAIEDNENTLRILREREEAWWNSLTPEQQQTVAQNRVKRMKTMAKFKAMEIAAKGGPRMSRFPNISLLPGSEAFH
jgi:hypothetical protein